MATVRTSFDVGPSARIDTIARLVSDVSTIAELGFRIDRSLARTEADVELERLWRDQPEALIEQVREIDEGAVSALRESLDYRGLLAEIAERQGLPPVLWSKDWYRIQRRYGPEPGRYLIPPPFPWLLQTSVSLRSTAPDVHARLLSVRAANQAMPTVPTVRSVAYENPLEIVFMIAVVGAVFKYGTFVKLIEIIRDWPTTRAQAKARIDKTRAETRLISVQARREEFDLELRRQFVVAGINRPELLDAKFSKEELEAISRLSASRSTVTIEEEDEA